MFFIEIYYEYNRIPSITRESKKVHKKLLRKMILSFLRYAYNIQNAPWLVKKIHVRIEMLATFFVMNISTACGSADNGTKNATIYIYL